MSGEKYLNHYVEILTGTMTDAVIRNISLQANVRVTEEVVNEQAGKIESLQNQLNNANNQLNELNKLRGDFENNKHQVEHIDTFRSELIKEREAHKKTRSDFEKQVEELTSQIEYLQLTPAKRKKIDEEKNKVVEVEVVSTLPIEESIRDGGSF